MNADLLLTDYRLLTERLDDHARRVAGEYGRHMNCRKGCDGCCQHLSLLWVEGFSLLDALRRSPENAMAYIRNQVSRKSGTRACPLLDDHACLLYDVRPVICRTHGLPLMNEGNAGPEIHCCPENFHELKNLPGSAVLDMEVVNASLATINSLFVAEFFPAGQQPAAERCTIAEFLCGRAETLIVDRMGDMF